MSQLIEEFNDYRARMNEVILGKNNKVINRLFNLDTNTYADGALPVSTKEMLGLVASMVLRCDEQKRPFQKAGLPGSTLPMRLVGGIGRGNRDDEPCRQESQYDRHAGAL